MSATQLTPETFTEWADSDPELACALAAVQDLPAMTDIVNDFLLTIEDPDWSAKSVAQVISRDPVVAASVLKVANSSYYSFQRQINNLEGAIAVLGLATIKSLVLTAGVKNMNKRFGLIEKLLLEDAIGCALCAREIARKTRCCDPEEAFLGGLLRHIGKIAMNNLDSEKYSELVQAVYNGEDNLTTLERKFFPYSHAAIGAAMLHHWHLAPQLVASTLFHNDAVSPEKIGEQASVLASLVHLGGLVCLRLGFGQRTPQEELDVYHDPATERLALTEEDIDDILHDIPEAVTQTCASFMG
ncbi:metal-dependent phosphohydrolase [Syntrophotalea carbinolica DSM 2380]|uniref:Metal-dependent phosphohydrolase n=1 Tax=Syntrophotalea carbinolica (strain DSM 2380 / NBRC 103641 / GraBd1) TaxID=338963 RepID=Q3A5R3_SYNC1|nr:HDOD domain-containing protein [Syntrophotalea carbinolica]ABA88294.1 metal-dependent phosphohydrolase [Syntrophotalea carbinolica DSM 2380]